MRYDCRVKKPSASARTRPASKSGAVEMRAARRELRKFALSLPQAVEDFPWGEVVAKVNGKVFVFLGCDPAPGAPIGLSVKLPESSVEALELPFTKPTGYGLGKSGWVTASFDPGEELPLEILKSWIRESYRAVAPKKLAAKTDLPKQR